MKIKIKYLISKFRDEVIGFILLVAMFNATFVGIVYTRQSKVLKNQRTMLSNDQFTKEQNKTIIDSISIKWNDSYNKLMQNARKKTGSN